ncbi:hypothetical protein [Schleiferilactobacillus harbinensis]|uniref:hypothetical protein n=1 Tax=Schleiferilactobacillus harbinensis TaxID=304207 RepID=UPI001167F19B|nr:hypothetical protein [Schleiferilactobacillus harbinensis]GEK06639.1 hypothetical protein LHA01_18780 [Schleiferilactobacillus harbinensis]
MKNKTFGLGDLFIAVAFVLMTFRMTGIITTSWVAITNFSFFVLIYLVVCFIIDVIIKVVDTVIAKKRDK